MLTDPREHRLVQLAAGGVAYTAGVVFYALDRFRFCHFIWHLFVLAGTTCHFIAVMGYSGFNPAMLAA